MRKIFLILLLTSIYYALPAQTKDYKILGRIEGENNLKYVFMRISGDTTMYKSSIVDNQFSIFGKYSPVTVEGMITTAHVFFSEHDSDQDYLALIRSKLWSTKMMMEAKIDFVFNVEKKTSIVKGGDLNKIQSLFSMLHESYLNKLDSAYRNVDLEDLDSIIKVQKKKDIKRNIYVEEQAGTLDLMNAHPDSEVALVNFIPFSMVPSFIDGRARRVFNNFSERIRTSKYGIRLNGFLTDMEQKITKPNMVNKIMPFFELAGLDGKVMKSTDLFGKYTLVDFWASWCAPCRAENPNILAAFNNYHNKGLNIVAISIDQLKDKEKWVAAIENDNTKSFTHLLNPGGISGIARELNINSVPANYLLDSEGKIIAVDLRGDQLDKKLKELFPM